MSKVNTLINEIIDGEYDGDFEVIYEAIKSRRRAQEAGKALTFRVNDKVRFNSHARPKYLKGIEGVVIKVNGASVVVKVGPEAGRFANQEPRCPIAIVDKI